MKKIVIASENPVKIQAALNGFQRMFPGEEFVASGVSAPSDVSDQPASDQETLQGASNRACHAQQQVAQADFWVGIEGGIQDWDAEMAAFAWVVVLDHGQLVGFGKPHDVLTKGLIRSVFRVEATFVESLVLELMAGRP